MKNFEKYEKEIKEVIGSNGCLDTLFSKLSNMPIYESDGIANWLYEEYEEPLLTKEERKYLKAVIEPYKEDFDYLFQNIRTTTIHFKDGSEILISQFKYFKNLNLFERYTLEGLGL